MIYPIGYKKHDMNLQWDDWFDYVRPNQLLHTITITRDEAKDFIRKSEESQDNLMYSRYNKKEPRHPMVIWIEDVLRIDDARRNYLAGKTMSHVLKYALKCQNFAWFNVKPEEKKEETCVDINGNPQKPQPPERTYL